MTAKIIEAAVNKSPLVVEDDPEAAQVCLAAESTLQASPVAQGVVIAVPQPPVAFLQCLASHSQELVVEFKVWKYLAMHLVHLVLTVASQVSHPIKVASQVAGGLTLAASLAEAAVSTASSTLEETTAVDTHALETKLMVDELVEALHSLQTSAAVHVLQSVEQAVHTCGAVAESAKKPTVGHSQPSLVELTLKLLPEQVRQVAAASVQVKHPGLHAVNMKGVVSPPKYPSTVLVVVSTGPSSPTI